MRPRRRVIYHRHINALRRDLKSRQKRQQAEKYRQQERQRQADILKKILGNPALCIQKIIKDQEILIHAQDLWQPPGT